MPEQKETFLNPQIRQLFDYESWTYSYLVFDPQSLDAVSIDPVLEQHPRDLKLIRELGLKLIYVLETHVNTDHQSGAEKLAETTEAQTAIGRGTGSSTASIILEDGQELSFGAFSIKALATPGHTPGCMSFQLEGMLFCGDTLFIRSCGRTDFQQGDPRVLYQSIHEKIFRLPPETLVYPGHDYNGIMVSTIGEELRWNTSVGHGISEQDFVERMKKLHFPGSNSIEEERTLPLSHHAGLHV